MKLHQRMGDVPIDLRQLVPAEYFPFRDVEAWEDTRVGLEPGRDDGTDPDPSV